jgi:hypothetical protein
LYFKKALLHDSTFAERGFRALANSKIPPKQVFFDFAMPVSIAQRHFIHATKPFKKYNL